MYGPLVMATTDIDNWEKATIDYDEAMSNVKFGIPYDNIPKKIAIGPSKNKVLKTVQEQKEEARAENPAEVNIYSIYIDGKTFLPDYYVDRRCTHYFRLRMAGTPDQVVVEGEEAGADISALRETMGEAKIRRNAQQRWNDLEVKVPEYAPWAKHGFDRMMQQLAAAQGVLDDPKLATDQKAIDRATASLNAALNAMRPGNLPELEDMDELLPLLEQAKAVQKPSKQLQEAIDYADMVVKYVSDGSGTLDMINKATNLLKNAKRKK